MLKTSWFVKVVRSGKRYEDGTLPPEVWRGGVVCPTLNVFDNTGDSRATVIIIQEVEVIGIQNTVIGRADTAGPQGKGYTEEGDPMFTLDTSSPHAVAVIPIHDTATRYAGKRKQSDGSYTFDGKGNGLGVGKEGDPMNTLTGGDRHAVAYDEFNDSLGGDIHHTLRAGAKQSTGGLINPVIMPTLTASNNPSRSPQSSEVTAQVAAINEATSIVRRLTPLECERLQGLPATEKSVKIRVWLDILKSPVSVEILSPKQPPVAGSVEKIESTENVKSAEPPLVSKHPLKEKPVQLNVHINCGALTVELLNQKKSNSNASNAGRLNWLVLPILKENFAHLGAVMTSIVDLTIMDGGEELQGNEILSMEASPGKKQEKLYGREMTQPVNIVEPDSTIPLNHTMSTILSRLDIKNLEQNLLILFSSVWSAIVGHIPQEIPINNSLVCQIKIVEGWTETTFDGKVQADSSRYKQTGNAVTVNVCQWIGERLK